MYRTAWRNLVAALGLTLLAWFVPMPAAHAYGPVPEQTVTVHCYTYGSNEFCNASASAAYTAWADYRHSIFVHGGDVEKVKTGSATCTPVPDSAARYCTGIRTFTRYPGSSFELNGISYFGNSSVRQEINCPADSEKVGSSCICKLGYEADGGTCRATDCSEVASSANAVGMMRTTGAGVSVCAGGCRLTGSVSAQAADSKWWVWPPYEHTGHCAGDPYTGNDPLPAGEPPPTPCGSGTCPGEVNGANVCLPCKQTVTPDGTKTTTNPDGTKTDTKSETKCDGTTCTTTKTETKTDASGNPIPGSETKTEEKKPQKTFCQENPTSPMCKASSFGGACGSPFNCDGDAVQCAMAKEQHKRACEWADVEEEAVNIGDAARSGGLLPDDHPFKPGNAESKEFAFSSLIDRTDRIGGSCPTNESFSILGQTLTLPFGDLCGPLGIMGNIAIAFSLLAAVRIVFH